jgi:ribokinase
VVLGVFMADTTYCAERQPLMGETLLGKGFALGPGGKGSNQAVAAAKAGGDVRFLTRLGRDTFAELARDTWRNAGVVAEIVEDDQYPTGAAYIFVEDGTRENAIIIAPGAATRISMSDVEQWSPLIASGSVFVTQLEQPVAVAQRALAYAKEAGATTVFDPAPAAALPEGMLALCDFVTPNEGEAERLTGLSVRTLADARRAADAMLAQGAGSIVVTLGKNGVLLHDRNRSLHIPPVVAGPVVETTGAGDAFNGGFAVALAEGADAIEAVRFGCVTAAISVTRAGTAPSMAERWEIDELLRQVAT